MLTILSTILSTFFYAFLIKYFTMLIMIIGIVSFYTLFERKGISISQRRSGPLLVGLLGLLQAVADGVKLLLKNSFKISSATKIVFVACPLFIFFLSIMGWCIIPLGLNVSFIHIKFNTLFLLAMSSVDAYMVILAGWGTNSKYSLLGSLRAAAQLISYELSLSLMLATIVLCSGSLNLEKIAAAQSYCWYCFQHSPIFMMFLITVLAETNRHPFDFAEAESELVSGLNVEYSSMLFALFFLAEYAKMVLMSVFTSIIFLGGWTIPFLTHLLSPFAQAMVLAIKTVLIMTFIVGARVLLPRTRYDYLMSLCWKDFLPYNLGWFVLTYGVLFYFDAFPAEGGYPEYYYHYDPNYLNLYGYDDPWSLEEIKHRMFSFHLDLIAYLSRFK